MAPDGVAVAGEQAEDPGRAPADGTALCLSGGGYRAMLFHVGALWRLNEVGYLPQLRWVSSVSGGSITAGVLGAGWRDLRFDDHGVATRFDDVLVKPVRRLAATTIDVGAVLGGLLPRSTAGERVAGVYDRLLFHGRTLQDLPADDDGPRFVLNATNLQSGALWRFSRPYMADYRVGRVDHPTVPLATAVAASSAFPPMLSPVVLQVDETAYRPDSRGLPLHGRPYTTTVHLSDGGVYDNLGLETAWKRYRTVLVSDGGGQLKPARRPARTWGRHMVRVLKVVDNQVRSLRKRHLIGAFERGEREGAYWGIGTDIADYRLPDALPCPVSTTTALALTPTRLRALPSRRQEALINWGYAVCDAALRRRVDRSIPAPAGFPYPRAGLGSRP
jgi:NTE family protein